MAGLAGLNPDFEQKLVTFLDSLPPNVRTRISLNSGYRDNATQARLFQNAVAKYGSVEAARKWVAPPGDSQHNLGKAMDLGIPNDLMAMVHAEAPKYGLTFPLSNENWHIEAAGGRGGGSGQGDTWLSNFGSQQQENIAGNTPGAGGVGALSTDTPAGSAYDRVHSHALTHLLTQEPDPQPQGVKLPGASSTNTAAPFGDVISSASSTYDVDPQILTNLLKTESHFDPNAVSPAGARGIAQFMPATAQSMGIDPLNPQQSIVGAAKYLKQLTDRYGGNVKLGLAAYNWGMGNVDKLNGDLSKAPPSVQSYVNGITGGVSGSGDTQNSVESIAKQVVAGVTDTGLSAPAAGAIPIVAPVEKFINTLAPPGPKGFQLPGMAADQSPGMEGMVNPNPITGAIGGAATPPVFAKVPASPQGTKLLPPVDTSVTADLERAATGGAALSNQIVGTRAPQTALERIARTVPAAGGLGWLLGGPIGAGIGVAGVLGNEAFDASQGPKAYDLPGGAADQAPGMESTVNPNPITGSIGAGAVEGGGPTAQVPPDNFNLKIDPTGQPLPIPAPQAAMPPAALPAIQLAAKTIPPAIMASMLALPDFTQQALNLTEMFGNNPIEATKAYDKYGPSGLILLAATAGFAALPKAIEWVSAQRIPRVNEIDPSVAPGKYNRSTGQVDPVQSLLTPKDVFSGLAVDYTKAILDPIRRYMKYNGMNFDFLHQLEMGWQHSAAFMANMSSFFENGEMNNLIGRIKVANDSTMAIAQRAAKMDPNVNVYLDLLRRKDDFVQKGSPNVIDGMTRADVIAKIQNMETMNPNLTNIAGIMKANRQAALQFHVDAGDMTQMEMTKALIARPNSVDPTLISDPKMRRDIVHPTARQLDPVAEQITAIMDRSRNAFKTSVNRDTVDGASRTGLNLFQRIPKAKAQNWSADKPALVTIKRNGIPEYYSTNPTWAVIMRHGPDKAAPLLIGQAKRLVEDVGTGRLAPGYPQTAQQRGFVQQALTHAVVGARQASYLGTKLAVPRVLGPQVARSMAQAIEASLLTDKSLSWLPDQYRQGLAMKLHTFVENSAQYALETHGGTPQGSYVADIARRNYSDKNPIGLKIPLTLAGIWHGYQDYLFATHGSPNAAVAFKALGVNLRKGMPSDQAAMEAAYAGANVTGNPRMSGAHSMSGVTVPGRPPRTDNPNAFFSKDGEAGRIEQGITGAVRGVSQAYRGYIPWGNVNIQSMRNVYEAYMRHPLSFTMGLYTHVITPAIASYLWNSALGPDYVSYMMDERHPQDALTQLAVGLPDRPPADGHKWAVPQEVSLISRGVQIFMDHMFRGGQTNTTQQDFLRMMGQYVRGVLLPAPPGLQTAVDPIYSMITKGIVRRQLPEPGDIPPAIDGVLSGFLGVFGHSFINALKAGYDEPSLQEAGYKNSSYYPKVWSAIKEGTRTIAQSIPLLREGFDIARTPVVQTQLNMQLAAKQQAIRLLSSYYKDKGQAFLTGVDPSVSTTPASRFGRGFADPEMEQIMGIKGKTDMPYAFPSATPNNPDWLNLAGRIQANFMSDNGFKLSPVQDIYGFATWMKEHNAIGKVIDDMRGKPNYGNLANWDKYIRDNDYVQTAIKNMRAGDRNRPDHVMQYLIHQYNMKNKALLQAILEAEHGMSQEVHHPVNIETLSPWIGGWGSQGVDQYVNPFQ